MPITQIRFREDDLFHVNDEVARCAEQILASARLPASYACRYDWGILVEQPESSRGRWPQRPGLKTEHRHLLDEIELGSDLGVFALTNRALDRTPAGKYVGVCAWFNHRAAAQYLWGRLHFCGFDRHVIETHSALGLTERPSNDERPGYSETRHGMLLRLDSALSQAAQKYFLLEEIMESSVNPGVIPLGGDSHLVFARSNNPNEPLRIMLVTGEWSCHIASKDLRRWLSSSSKQKEIPA